MKSINDVQSLMTNALIRAFELEESGDISGAIAEFKLASRLGSTDARSKLGTIFDDIIVPPQPKTAVYWYQRGVYGGDSGCAWNLAMHYAGLGIKRWYLYWLKIAASMGDPDAEKELKTEMWWNKRNLVKGR